MKRITDANAAKYTCGVNIVYKHDIISNQMLQNATHLTSIDSHLL